MWYYEFVEIGECGFSCKASIIKVEFLNSPPVRFGVVKRFSDFRSVHEKEAKLAKKIAPLHPSFVGCYGYFRRDSEYNIVMELCSKGSVMDEIKRRSENQEFWSEEALLVISLKLFEAMAALHEANLIHGDLKPHNLFVTEHNEVKIGDFGSGKWSASTFEKGTVRGTLAYFPPELVKAFFENRNYLKMRLWSVDVWCMGRTLYEMAVLTKIRNLNIEDQKQLDDELMRTLKERTNYSEAFCELLVNMHRVAPSDRPRFSALISELRRVQSIVSDLAYGETEAEEIPIFEHIHINKKVVLDSLDFISLPCSHSLELNCLENHLRRRASLDTLQCTQCQRCVSYTYLKGLTNSKIDNWLEAHFAVKMKSRCPGCQKEHSVRQLDRVYLSVPLTCSCSTSFCSLCFRSPPHRFMCRYVKRLT
jgi:NIMA (never in mitosis gene a)-related kinase